MILTNATTTMPLTAAPPKHLKHGRTRPTSPPLSPESPPPCRNRVIPKSRPASPALPVLLLRLAAGGDLLHGSRQCAFDTRIPPPAASRARRIRAAGPSTNLHRNPA